MLHLLLFLNLLAWRGRTVQCSPLPVADAARVKVSCLRTDNSRGLARSSAAVIKVGHELQLLFEEIPADAMAQQVNCSQGVHPSTHTHKPFVFTTTRGSCCIDSPPDRFSKFTHRFFFPATLGTRRWQEAKIFGIRSIIGEKVFFCKKTYKIISVCSPDFRRRLFDQGRELDGCRPRHVPQQDESWPTRTACLIVHKLRRR